MATPAERAIQVFTILEAYFEKRTGVNIRTFTPLVGKGKLFADVNGLQNFLNGWGRKRFGVVPVAKKLEKGTMSDLSLAYVKLGALK